MVATLHMDKVFSILMVNFFFHGHGQCFLFSWTRCFLFSWTRISHPHPFNQCYHIRCDGDLDIVFQLEKQSKPCLLVDHLWPLGKLRSLQMLHAERRQRYQCLHRILYTVLHIASHSLDHDIELYVLSWFFSMSMKRFTGFGNQMGLKCGVFFTSGYTYSMYLGRKYHFFGKVHFRGPTT